MFEKLLQRIYWFLESIRGGAGSIQDLTNEWAATLDLARSPQSGSTTTDGTEQDLYNTDDDPFAFYFGIGNVDLSLMQAGDTVVFKVYIKNVSGGAFFKISNDAANTYTGAQTDPAGIEFGPRYNQFGIQITIQRTGGGDRAYPAEFFDAKRGA